MKKLIIFIFLSNIYLVFGQGNNASKIDSVFNYFFNYLKIDENIIIDQHNDDSLCIFYDKQQTIIDFYENITNIYFKRELNNNAIYVIYSDSVFNKWEEWYNKNRTNLIWINDDKRIENPESKWFKCINYEEFYPSNIRFVCKPEEVPKSSPPKYIQEMIDKSHHNLAPRSAEVQINTE